MFHRSATLLLLSSTLLAGPARAGRVEATSTTAAGLSAGATGVGDCGPCPFASVQAAIDAAPPYATIGICEGAWNEDLLVDKPLRLYALGPGRPVLRSITIDGPVKGPDDAVILEGLEIRGGTAGIYAEDLLYDLVVDRCRILDATDDGGIYVTTRHGVLVTVRDSLIEGTRPTGYAQGGAIFFQSALDTRSHLEVVGSILRDNEGHDAGGIGLDCQICQSFTARIADTQILGNTSTSGDGYDGAAITARYVRVDIVDSHIQDNVAERADTAGAINAYDSVLRIDGSVIAGNIATDSDGGAAIRLRGSSALHATDTDFGFGADDNVDHDVLLDGTAVTGPSFWDFDGVADATCSSYAATCR